MAHVGPAGQVVTPWSLEGAVLGFLADRVSGLWRWREMTLPLAAVYVADVPLLSASPPSSSALS